MFKIKEIRKKVGFTQEILAKKVGISRIYINELENNRKQNPSISLLKKIADELNTSVKALISNGRREG